MKRQADIQSLKSVEHEDILFRHRFKELDGLRGIASLVVGVTHCLEAISIPASRVYSHFAAFLVLAILNGGIAVDLFFLLSGFFLSGMIAGVTLRKYYLRRLVRLVPPAIIAVGVYYLYSRFRPDLGPAAMIGLRELLLNFLLIRHGLNPVLWTIRIEIAISILFPLVLLAKKLRSGLWYKTILFAIFVLLAIILRNDQKLGVDVFHYLYIFYAGSLARDYGSIIRKLHPSGQFGVFLTATAGLGLTGFLDPSGAYHPFLYDLLATVFGTAVIMLVSSGNLGKIQIFLKSGIIQFMAKVSYSFYLMNFLAVRIVAALVLSLALRQVIGIPGAALVLLSAGICLSYVLGYVFNVLIEQPATRLSRLLGKNDVGAAL